MIGKIKSYPKINLYLRITGKRKNGYHDIETLFVPLDNPYDEITISESGSKGISVSANSPTVPDGEKNICWRAAAKFAEKAEISPGWKIDIFKNIPVAAGLGGGSSNAAAVLKTLNKKYSKLSERELAEIALSLGADVPFFLNPTPSLGKGTGEVLTPVEIHANFALILVNPLFPITAAWGYNNYIPCSRKTTLDEFIETLKEGKIPEYIVNDLSNAVFKKFPIMEILKDSMLNAGATCVGMSGSGPTLFGICEFRSTAESAAEKLKKKFGNSIYCTTSSILS